mmetsp:Transcript_7616/g.17066  ORF Transcript_7616/g.17066 Transcript_7616/m.17066 type:complete len:223 (+) Transcript_7616:1308-1976(+)
MMAIPLHLAGWAAKLLGRSTRQIQIQSQIQKMQLLLAGTGLPLHLHLRLLLVLVLPSVPLQPLLPLTPRPTPFLGLMRLFFVAGPLQSEQFLVLVMLLSESFLVVGGLEEDMLLGKFLVVGVLWEKVGPSGPWEMGRGRMFRTSFSQGICVQGTAVWEASQPLLSALSETSGTRRRMLLPPTLLLVLLLGTAVAMVAAWPWTLGIAASSSKTSFEGARLTGG